MFQIKYPINLNNNVVTSVKNTVFIIRLAGPEKPELIIFQVK